MSITTSMEKMNGMLELSEPSICIPRVFANIGQYRIKEVFQKIFGVNSIERVDIVRKNDGRRSEPYNKVFVHFRYWSIEHADIRDKLINGKEIKIVYEQPWFWKCTASRSKRNNKKTKYNPDPYIMTDKDLKKDFELPPLSILDKYIIDVHGEEKEEKEEKEENNVEAQCKIRGAGRINDGKNISSWEEYKQLDEEDRRKMKRKFVNDDNSDNTDQIREALQIVYVNENEEKDE